MKPNRSIKIVGAREHNLKDITVEIPKESLTVVTGPSGSGKSTLALDVLYAEGQRRYMESLSSYARQFLGMPQKPDVDAIEGLCPAIAIEQKTVGANPRSTVGTITELYDYLRVLFARIGIVHCPKCYNPIQSASAEQVAERLIHEYAGLTISIVAPLANEKKGTFVSELENYFKQGYYRFIIDGERISFKSLDEIAALDLKKTYKHTIDILLDTVEISNEEFARIQEAIEKAFNLASNQVKIIVGTESFTYSSARMCMPCNSSVPELEPRLFSFNSPIGACKKCHGLGVEIIVPWATMKNSTMAGLEFADRMGVYQEITCSACKGERLNELALAVTIGEKNLFQVGELSVSDALDFFKNLKLSELHKTVSKRLLHEIVQRYQFLFDVGLSYLTLNRTARTLSGGEGQRIRLATQIGSALSGVVYVLDEPSIGLHQRDNDKLIATLHKLRDQGNTVVVVEHDSDTMLAADYIIDMGPAAGKFGGNIVATGTPAQIMKNKDSLSGAYLSGKLSIERIKPLRKPTGFITLNNATEHNLKDLSVAFPLGVLCGISGVSGSGKSSLIMDELVPAIKKALPKRGAFEVDKITGVNQLENLIVIDQKPIGRTSRSNPATYLGIFDDIRKLYASLPESNARGYTVGHFSFNTGPGRCPDCSGEGTITVSMHFLPDVVMVCNRCKGKRYTKSVLEILYKGKSIADILEMTAIEAQEFFAAHTSIVKRIKLMCEVGLDYIALGQSSTTLSGGEAQRIKLVDELAKRGSKTLYILDEPTTGLHAHDIKRLLGVFERLLEKGNSLIVIEHNLDVLKVADYIIDLGPEGGDKGGMVVAQGTPAEIAATKQSYTGFYLKKLLK